MAQLVIHFDPRSAPKQRVFYVALASDEDATPSEHEQTHKQIVGKLLGGINLGGDPRVEVERDKPQAEPSLSCSCGDGDYQVIDLG